MPKEEFPELKLSFINGDGLLSFAHVKEIHFDPDSKAAIDLGLEECKQLPPHIQNRAQRALYVEIQGKLRKWEEAIKKPGTEQKDELNEIKHLIEDCIKAELKPFADELTRVIDQITRWDSTVKVGLSSHTASLRRKGLDAQSKAEKSTSKKEQKRQESIARQYFKEADKVEKEEKTGHTDGAVHKERWGGEIADPLELIRRADKCFYKIVLDQSEINDYCKDIERNGGSIHPTKTIPGLKLSKKPYTAFYA